MSLHKIHHQNGMIGFYHRRKGKNREIIPFFKDLGNREIFVLII